MRWAVFLEEDGYRDSTPWPAHNYLVNIVAVFMMLKKVMIR